MSFKHCRAWKPARSARLGRTRSDEEHVRIVSGSRNARLLTIGVLERHTPVKSLIDRRTSRRGVAVARPATRISSFRKSGDDAVDASTSPSTSTTTIGFDLHHLVALCHFYSCGPLIEHVASSCSCRPVGSGSHSFLASRSHLPSRFDTMSRTATWICKRLNHLSDNLSLK